jgi:hypothetical protein
MRLLALAGRVLGTLFVAALLGGCPTSRYVMMDTALDPSRPVGDCFEICSRAFGVRPTVSCGAGNGAGVRCIYLERAPELPSRSLDPPECRATCARAGMPDVESCEAMTSLGSEPVVACAYRVGYH